MVTNHTAAHANAQPSLESIPQTLLAELWESFCAHASSCVASAIAPIGDGEPEPMRWDCTGLDHLGLRKIVRMSQWTAAGPVDTIWQRNYPGLRDAIPARGLVRRPNFDGGDRRIDDDTLAREFTLTILGRGRGLRDRGLALVRELSEARCLGVGYFDRKGAVHLAPARFTPAQRAAITRERLSPTQWRILEALAFARGALHKLGLWGNSEGWGRVFGCNERSIRRAMVGLERLGIAWRHYTPAEGTDGRRVDQAANMIIPGPQWMRIDPLWTGDNQSDALEHWGGVARMRNAEARERNKWIKACKRARASGETPPIPVGGYPLEFSAWVAEQLDASDKLESARERLEQLDSKALDVSTDCARAIVVDRVSPLEVYQTGQPKRDEKRQKLAKMRGDVMATTTFDALGRDTTHADTLRTHGSDAEGLGERACAAANSSALYSRYGADKLAAPPQAVRNPREKVEPGLRCAPAQSVTDLRDALARRFGAVVKASDWTATGDRERRSGRRVPQGRTVLAPRTFGDISLPTNREIKPREPERNCEILEFATGETRLNPDTEPPTPFDGHDQSEIKQTPELGTADESRPDRFDDAIQDAITGGNAFASIFFGLKNRSGE